MKVNQGVGQSSGTQTAGVESAKKTQKADEAKKESGTPKKAPAVEAGATADISFRAKEMAKAKAVADAAPDVREEKIAELKRRVEAGEYSVSANKVADKMVDDHLKTASN